LITVKNLTKKFGNITAVNNISFEIDSGEIVGFLGINGAGKSTTMRMLNSYLTPTSGQILINGYCTHKNSLQARRQLGYMPENTPLPQELRVIEYLKFRSELKRVPRKNIKKEIQSSIEQCILQDVSNRVIGTLSKGYQQRVALADALLNSPPILVLDEPTVGLDPNQITHIREVIKNVGVSRTVLLSTHIMQEVESICNKIIIMHKGKILISESIQNLKQKLGHSSTVNIIAKCNAGKLKEILERMPDVKSIYVHKDNNLENFAIETIEGINIQEKLFQIFVENDATIYELKRQQSTLEEIFAKITSRNLNEIDCEEVLN
jgi:ABC-2 type transport system ATP-binding protein